MRFVQFRPCIRICHLWWHHSTLSRSASVLLRGAQTPLDNLNFPTATISWEGINSRITEHVGSPEREDDLDDEDTDSVALVCPWLERVHRYIGKNTMMDLLEVEPSPWYFDLIPTCNHLYPPALPLEPYGHRSEPSVPKYSRAVFSAVVVLEADSLDAGPSNVRSKSVGLTLPRVIFVSMT